MEYLKDLSLVLYSSSYTPLLSISNSAANHHLYADDTQLLLSFSANITHFENTITNSVVDRGKFFREEQLSE